MRRQQGNEALREQTLYGRTSISPREDQSYDQSAEYDQSEREAFNRNHQTIPRGGSDTASYPEISPRSNNSRVSHQRANNRGAGLRSTNANTTVVVPGSDLTLARSLSSSESHSYSFADAHSATRALRNPESGRFSAPGHSSRGRANSTGSKSRSSISEVKMSAEFLSGLLSLGMSHRTIDAYISHSTSDVTRTLPPSLSPAIVNFIRAVIPHPPSSLKGAAFRTHPTPIQVAVHTLPKKIRNLQHNLYSKLYPSMNYMLALPWMCTNPDLTGVIQNQLKQLILFRLRQSPMYVAKRLDIANIDPHGTGCIGSPSLLITHPHLARLAVLRQRQKQMPALLSPLPDFVIGANLSLSDLGVHGNAPFSSDVRNQMIESAMDGISDLEDAEMDEANDSGRLQDCNVSQVDSYDPDASKRDDLASEGGEEGKIASGFVDGLLDGEEDHEEDEDTESTSAFRQFNRKTKNRRLNMGQKELIQQKKLVERKYKCSSGSGDSRRNIRAFSSGEVLREPYYPSHGELFPTFHVPTLNLRAALLLSTLNSPMALFELSHLPSRILNPILIAQTRLMRVPPLASEMELKLWRKAYETIEEPWIDLPSPSDASKLVLAVSAEKPEVWVTLQIALAIINAEAQQDADVLLNQLKKEPAQDNIRHLRELAEEDSSTLKYAEKCRFALTSVTRQVAPHGVSPLSYLKLERERVVCAETRRQSVSYAHGLDNWMSKRDDRLYSPSESQLLKQQQQHPAMSQTEYAKVNLDSYHGHAQANALCVYDVAASITPVSDKEELLPKYPLLPRRPYTQVFEPDAMPYIYFPKVCARHIARVTSVPTSIPSLSPGSYAGASASMNTVAIYAKLSSDAPCSQDAFPIGDSKCEGSFFKSNLLSRAADALGLDCKSISSDKFQKIIGDVTPEVCLKLTVLKRFYESSKDKEGSKADPISDGYDRDDESNDEGEGEERMSESDEDNENAKEEDDTHKADAKVDEVEIARQNLIAVCATLSSTSKPQTWYKQLKRNNRKFLSLFKSKSGLFDGKSEDGSPADAAETLQRLIDSLKNSPHSESVQVPKEKFAEMLFSTKAAIGTQSNNNQLLEAEATDVGDSNHASVVIHGQQSPSNIDSDLQSQPQSELQLLNQQQQKTQVTALKQLLPDGSMYWNVLWSWRQSRVNHQKLLAWQKVNHFPRAFNLTRKDFLKRNIERYRKLGGPISAESFHFIPRTFCLPAERSLFTAAFKERQLQCDNLRESGEASVNNRNIWIVKPTNSSRGRGIFVTEKLSEVPSGSSPSVVQEYIANPLLIDGRKFDLRMYVLVTSFEPLEAFIYEEGFARLSMRPYSTDSEGLSDLFVHLTNSSIQQKKPTAVKSPTKLTISPRAKTIAMKINARLLRDDESEKADSMEKNADGSTDLADNDQQLKEEVDDEEVESEDEEVDDGESSDKDDDDNCSKVRMSDVLPILRRRGYDIQRLLGNIDSVVLKSLMCVQSRIGPQANCFEVFGYDILIDDQLKPWLIEVNASPSFNLETPIDKEVKPRMVADALTIVDPLPYDRAYLARLLEYRSRNGFWPAAPEGNSDDAKSEGNQSLCSDPDVDLNSHFHRILNGRVPRLYGQAPPRLGGFRQIAPGPLNSPFGRLARFHDALVKRRQRHRALLNPSLVMQIINAPSEGKKLESKVGQTQSTTSSAEEPAKSPRGGFVSVETTIINQHRIQLPPVL